MAVDTIQNVKQKASYFIIAVVMWEFFSYFGLQAMLILYLTQYLHIPDKTAYQIYGSFTSLIFITPILGGVLADKFCGYRHAVIWGSLLIICGHIVLSSLKVNSLYCGLSLLVLGIGLFKSNAICLIADCYDTDSAGKNAAFSLYYVSGNVGAIASQLLCPYFAENIGWSSGFFIAAIGMFLGVITLILSRPYFKWYSEKQRNKTWEKMPKTTKTTISALIVLSSYLLTYFLMVYSLVGYFLILSSLFVIFIAYNIYGKLALKDKKKTILLGVLTLFATLFWALDQQGSSSISIFISRFVDRHIGGFIVPAGMFQAINPAAILIAGLASFKLWKFIEKKKLHISSAQKFSVAIIFLIISFFILSHSALSAENGMKASMVLPIISLTLIGVSEIFVDPVLLSEISNITPEDTRGRLVAIYYFFVGAVANYFAAFLAKFTVAPSEYQDSSITYHLFYDKVWYFFTIILLVLCLFFFRSNSISSLFFRKTTIE